MERHQSSKQTMNRRQGTAASGQFKNRKFGNRKRGPNTKELTDKQKGIMRHYHRILKKEHRQRASRDGGSEEASKISNSIAENKKRMKMTAYQRAQMVYEEKEAERKRIKEEEERQGKERQAALKKYRKKKFERLHKLSKKTSKGQPVMKGRIEVLLEKIQENLAKENS